jgi:hypothetical protein
MKDGYKGARNQDSNERTQNNLFLFEAAHKEKAGD